MNDDRFFKLLQATEHLRKLEEIENQKIDQDLEQTKQLEQLIINHNKNKPIKKRLVKRSVCSTCKHGGKFHKRSGCIHAKSKYGYAYKCECPKFNKRIFYEVLQ